MTDERVLLDVNVLVALAWPQHVHHVPAGAWFAGFEGRFFTTPITESGLVRLSMNRAVTGMEVSAAQVLALVTAIRSHDRHGFVADGSTLAAPAIRLDRLATGRQVTDAHLVNLCALEGMTLVTFDRGILDVLEPEDQHLVRVLDPRP